MKKRGSFVLKMGEPECMESDVGIDGQSSISGLDENLLGEILSRLPIQSIVAASATCRRWCSILHEGPYYRRRAAYNFRAKDHCEWRLQMHG
ncbi:hypothetical protein KP509_16G055500 [Ceratopteris richardii]|uniref:F-box domain-containing protein n=1 Tax=Ceratopteris richardii TaxID=49495 RepID=A0A8T2T0I4_CERRI|nr:hypothetical protein KP509_16G055500 [Ceratopteris richardii]